MRLWGVVEVSDGPRVRWRCLENGQTLLVLDRMKPLEGAEMADWLAARATLVGMGYVPLRFTDEIEIDDDGPGGVL